MNWSVEGSMPAVNVIRGVGVTGVTYAYNLAGVDGGSVPRIHGEFHNIVGASPHSQCIIHSGFAYNWCEYTPVLREMLESSSIWDSVLSSLGLQTSKGIFYIFSDIAKAGRFMDRNLRHHCNLEVDELDFRETYLECSERDIGYGKNLPCLVVDNGRQIVSDLPDGLEAICLDKYSEVTVFRSDEVSVRPMKAIGAMLETISSRTAGEALSAEPGGGSPDVNAEFHALGRAEFEKKSGRKIPVERVWTWVLYGKNLPLVNLFFADAIELPEQFSQKLKKQPRYGGISITSHQGEDANFWLVNSNALHPFGSGDDLTFGLNLVKELVSSIVPSAPIEQSRMRIYLADLPSLETINETVTERCQKAVSYNPPTVIDYVERFTLATVLVRRLQEHQSINAASRGSKGSTFAGDKTSIVTSGIAGEELWAADQHQDCIISKWGDWDDLLEFCENLGET